jgi:hypothetical protein
VHVLGPPLMQEALTPRDKEEECQCVLEPFSMLVLDDGRAMVCSHVVGICVGVCMCNCVCVCVCVCACVGMLASGACSFGVCV